MIGSNVPTRGGLPNCFRYGDEWYCECIQIYVSPSRRWQVSDLSQEEVTAFKEMWRRSSVKQVVAHIPLLVNIASPNNNIWHKSINRLIAEICRCKKLGISLLVLHPGSHRWSSRKKGISRIVEALNTIAPKIGNSPTEILLETMAGQGKMIGSRFEEIAYILERVENSKHFGVCFDTAHVFISGYEIRGYLGYENTMKKFDDIVGCDKIKVIHLNDSKTMLGSQNDRHACIGEGKLGLQLFHAILQDPRFRGIPKILEIPERDERSKDNVRLLRKLLRISHFPSLRKVELQLTLEES